MQTYHNDQAHIAHEFFITDEHITQTARLAILKINSYKLSLIKSSFANSQRELSGIIKESLLNYTDTGIILDELGFFLAESDN